MSSQTDLSNYGNIASTSDFSDSAMHLKFLSKIQRICNAIGSYRASLIIPIPHVSNVAFSINIVLAIVLTLSDRVFLVREVDAKDISFINLASKLYNFTRQFSFLWNKSTLSSFTSLSKYSEFKTMLIVHEFPKRAFSFLYAQLKKMIFFVNRVKRFEQWF